MDSASDVDYFVFDISATGDLYLSVYGVDSEGGFNTLNDFPANFPEPAFSKLESTMPQLEDLLDDPSCRLFLDDVSGAVYSFGGDTASDNDSGVGRDCFIETGINLGDGDKFFFEVSSQDGGTGTYVFEYIWNPD